MQGETLPNSAQTVSIPPAAHHHAGTLFHHEPRPHQPRDINLVHEAEKAASSINQKIAIGLTKAVGTMVCAYIFAALAISGFPGLFNAQVSTWVQWTSQTFIQLTMLSVIMVGQSVLGRKQELQADEQFRTTMSTYHDIEQVIQHLSAQDAELLRHAHMLEHLLEKNGISLQQLVAEGTSTSRLESYIQPQVAQNTSTTPAEGEK